MTRLLVALAAALALLVLGESYLRARQAAQRELVGVLRPLQVATVDAVNRVEVTAASGRRWQYVRADSTWHYPDYFDAFVLPQRIDHLLKSLLQTPASVVSVEPGDGAHYGLRADSPILLLRAESGAEVMQVRLGRGTPDARAGEAYVQLVGGDTIYHLHANPAHAFDAADPPMLDRRVQPRALARGAVEHIAFAGGKGDEVRALQRALKEPGGPSMPSMPPSGPVYEWNATYADGERTCVASSVFSYVGYLDRLTWSTLRDPKRDGDFVGARSIYLKDEQGRVDTLEVGRAAADGRLLRYRRTGQIFTITQAKADLLFPSEAALLDTLPRSNPYEQVEPYTPF